MSDNLESLVFIALGEASMCWSDIDKAGVFESSRCAEIGYRLVSEINSVLKPQASVEGGAVDNSTQQANTAICPNCHQEAGVPVVHVTDMACMHCHYRWSGKQP